jgi:hypothetical protein
MASDGPAETDVDADLQELEDLEGLLQFNEDDLDEANL